ncbi:MAG: MBL fold metallo-hydrolase [Cellvibrionaceae bacterium]|nr:MBL fold metallo-hydrolase [Cellvibrionaceae bacterium]MCV6628165.1 MBL fold metallo-hydrolase [Cellvibrionaceae bacterium]
MRVLLSTVLVLGIAASATYYFRIPLSLWLVERSIDRTLASNLLAELPDGLHLVLCGAGSPFPDPKRSGPCSAVIAGGRLFIVDSGSGASGVLNRLRLPQGDIEAVLLTHYHSDHIDGLGELMLQRWITGSHQTPLRVIGPEGLSGVVAGFNKAYSRDSVYRIDSSGQRIAPGSGPGGSSEEFKLPEDGTAITVYEKDGVVIQSMPMLHHPVNKAVAYRFDYQGRSLVISGDTSKNNRLVEFAQGVDLLVHEALQPKLMKILERSAEAHGRKNIAKISRDIVDYHSTPQEAATIAEKAQVGFLLFNHIVPPLPLASLEEVFTEGVGDIYSGPYRVGSDGDIVQMPAGSKLINQDNLF